MFWLDCFLLYTVSLIIIVVIHEFGHYMVARLCNIRVLSFSVGFGPELIGITSRSGVRWKVSLIPLGGYVSFSEDEKDMRSFFCAAPWKKILTVLAGPLANCVMAILFFTFFFYNTGVMKPVVSNVSPASPAAIAGVKKGDCIISLDGITVSAFEEVAPYVRENPLHEISLVLYREHVGVLHLKVMPRLQDTVDRFGIKRQVPSVGILFSYDETKLHSRTVLQSFSRGLDEISSITRGFLGVLSSAFGKDTRLNQISGPVGIARIAKNFFDHGFNAYIAFLAMFSWAIGFMNLLPIPILDGGHLITFLLEMIRGKSLGVSVTRVITRMGLCIILFLFFLGIRNDIYGLMQ
ncbi:RIP metalloprotease RseP [Candidatus Liberibacter asiaticus]|uniref:Zinc metalloprotease n=3 Tax=Liberibacter asiaticus TaxID=34021 RepID=A0ABM5NFY5_LIBAS|nr:RIP metalloprotease RseP [Candidatus Liberibacter asiaticus]AGH16791.1 zinc metallopeptidase [Candidatus Liberibacter asiaticus str. gxpsy]ASK52632.1 RIP metalloprotease RseP [Candidatus Liberibacter asiaticus]KAE9515588.1 Metalloprotease MmpA [Candidatus Liberibacter asiaticus]KAE9516622.1 Metalloprotease MmpA [Candidatus Liberibacter asiaticus]KIH95730.1 zinc metalloprotease [Candidatus Liberibacter asiaticus]